MSHTAADGVAMVAAAKKSGRIVQIGSQRVSSLICAKAKEIIASGHARRLMLVEGSLGRNDPTGAWEYPPPFDLSPANLDWDTWQGDVAPKRPFDPIVFARWRCWKEYGTGVAGDLLVHLVSGMMFMLGINEPPSMASAIGGHPSLEGRAQHADVHATNYYYGDLPVHMRLNLGDRHAGDVPASRDRGDCWRSPGPASRLRRRRATTIPRATTPAASHAQCAKSTSENGTRKTTPASRAKRWSIAFHIALGAPAIFTPSRYETLLTSASRATRASFSACHFRSYSSRIARGKCRCSSSGNRRARLWRKREAGPVHLQHSARSLEAVHLRCVGRRVQAHVHREVAEVVVRRVDIRHVATVLPVTKSADRRGVFGGSLIPSMTLSRSPR